MAKQKRKFDLFTFFKTKEEQEKEQKIKEKKLQFLDELFLPFYKYNTVARTQFLIEQFLPVGYLAILAAPPKSGKTSIATAIALSVALGMPFAGRQTLRAPVLWLSLEESLTERRELLSKCPYDIPLLTDRLEPDLEEYHEHQAFQTLDAPIYTSYFPIRMEIGAISTLYAAAAESLPIKLSALY